MSESDETLEQNDPVLEAIGELSKKIDAVQAEVSSVKAELASFKKDTDAQLESIREGIVHNGVAFDRLQAVVFNLRADVREMSEEIRHIKTPA